MAVGGPLDEGRSCHAAMDWRAEERRTTSRKLADVLEAVRALAEPDRRAARPRTEEEIAEVAGRLIGSLLQASCRIELRARGNSTAPPPSSASSVAIALRAHGESFGVMALSRSGAPEAPFDEGDLAIAQSLAAHVALAIESARAAARRDLLTSRLRKLAEATRDFAGATKDQTTLYELVAARLGALVGDDCTVLLLTEDEAELRPVAFFAPSAEAIERRRQLFQRPFVLVEHASLRRVVETRAPLIIADVEPAQLSDASSPYARFAAAEGVRGVLVVPLAVRDRIVGLVALSRYGGAGPPYDEDDLSLAQSLADHAALAVENAGSLARERDAQRRYRDLFERNPHPMLVVDPASESVHEGNEAAARLFGRPAPALRRLALSDLVPGDAAAALGPLLTQEGFSSSASTTFLRGGGAPSFHADVRSIPVVDGEVARRLWIVSDRTEHEATERARRVAEERFARLRDSGIVGIVVGSLDGRILEVNRAFCDIVGHTSAELIEPAHRGALTPAEWSIDDAAALSQLTSEGVAAPREKELLRKDGTRVPVLVGSAMLEGERDGETARCVSFVLDLRGVRRMEVAVAHLREARASEAMFRHFIEGAPDAIVVTDRNGRLLLVNWQTERMFGYGRDELLGQPMEMLIPERARSRHHEHRARYVESPSPRAMGAGAELFGRRKDGSEFPVEISLSPLTTAHGIVVSAAVRDVTERRKAEQQRASLAAIVDSSGDAIVGESLEGIVTSWNDGARRILGYAAEEIVGRHVEVLVPVDRRAIELALARSRAEAEGASSFDTVRVHKDGSLVDLSVTYSPVRDPSGKLVGISQVGRDITARRAAEQAALRARDDAQAANRELEAFSYSVAHDLRAPLRGMNGFAQLLLESYRDRLDPEAVDWLREIADNGVKMGLLIDALLSLSRVSRVELTEDRVDLGAMARSAIDALSREEPGREVEVAVHGDLVVHMDPALAAALVDNLAGNAWKFTRKTPHARIDVGVLDAEAVPTFFFRDNGAGFDMRFYSKLFGPFQRLHTADEFPGTGVGLATVQRIVHRHGGRVWADAALGRGATFFFSLPRATRARRGGRS